MHNPYIKTLEPVWRNLNNVFINEAKLQKLIGAMRKKQEKGELAIPAWAEPNIAPPMDCSLTEWIDFVCWTNTINFAFTNFTPPFGKFSIEYPKGVFWRGALALEASFMRAQKEKFPIFNAWHLKDIFFSDMKHIFRSIDNNHQMPMLMERWKILREVSRVLIERYDGNWLNLFEAADWRAFNAGNGIVEQLVANFPSFKDERAFKGHVLEFHKRAQLLAMVYHGRALHACGEFPPIADIDDIGPICDYEVPKALAFPDVGAIEYSPEMKGMIQRHYIFSPGHPMETENRLATAYVMKRICDESGLNMAQADYYFWEMGRKSKEPHILVPTTDY